MATIPFPYATDGASKLNRTNFRAPRLLSLQNPDAIRRGFAEVERGFTVTDNNIAQIERRLRILEAEVFP